MKVSEEEYNNIRKDYLDLRKMGSSKTEARQLLSQKYDRGLTTIWDTCIGTDYGKLTPMPVLDKKLFNSDWPKTYILTSWELRVGVDEKFIACLEQLAKYYDAELLLVPCNKSDIQFLPEVLKDKFNIVTENVKFNDNVNLKYVETSALVQSPLAGHVGAYPDATTIIPGLVKELRTEPSQHYVKQTMSTGSVGHLDAHLKDYPSEDKEFIRKWRTVSSRRHGRPTAIAENYVIPSALILDVLDNKTFLTRFVSSYRSGVVYDLGKKFTPEGHENSQPAALVVGDTHAFQTDNEAIGATMEMISYLNPKEVILHDFWDGISMNHHELHNAVKQHQVPSIADEAEVTKDLLREFCDVSNKIIYIQSNHDNFIESFLDGNYNNWRMNRNYEVSNELQLYRLKTGKHPIIKLLDLESFKNLKFVAESENHYVGKVLVKHGHEGNSGMRSGFLSLARIYNFYVQAHTHSPTVYRNAVCAGLTAKLYQGYNKGASAWLHANVIIQPDNSMQLVNIIRGSWIL